jgi:MoaA/NifB/PqqE/SkfB family radical SAM enzyme
LVPWFTEKPPVPLDDITQDEYVFDTKVLRCTIHLTNRCNLRCPYCGLESGPENKINDLPLEKVKEAIDILADYGIRRVELTGGEPLLHTNLFEILEYASSKGVSLGLITNGTLISEEFAKRLARYKVHSLKMSLDGLRDTNDSTRGKGTFDKVVNAIGHIKKHSDIKVKIMVTMTKSNASEIAPLARFLSDLGVWRMVIRPCVAVGRADESFVPDERCIMAAYRDITAIASALKDDFIEWGMSNPDPHMKIWADSPYMLVEESGRHMTILTDGRVVIDFCKGIIPGNTPGNIFTDDLRAMLAEVEDKARDKIRFNATPPLKVALVGTAMVRAESLKRDRYFREKIERKLLPPPFGVYRLEYFLRERFRKEIEDGKVVIDVIDPALATVTDSVPEVLGKIRESASATGRYSWPAGTRPRPIVTPSSGRCRGSTRASGAPANPSSGPS